MHQYGKRICALLLALCMVVGILPASVQAEEATTQIVSQQLFLGDDLTMHFYGNVSQEHAADAVVNIAVGGAAAAEYTVKDMTAEEDGTYDFFVDLGAAQMTEEIVLTLTSGGVTVLEKTYSIQEYAHELLEGNYTKDTKAMVKEMLNYGAKAQLYFGYKTDDLANAGYEIETEAVIAGEAPEVTVSGKVSGIRYHGAAMVFESKIAVRYYFQITGSADYTVTVNDTPYDLESKGGYHYIEVDGINPQEMDTLMAVKVSDGTDALSFSYSPMYYITRMYNKEDSGAELKALLAAANGYFEAAKVFTGVAENRTDSLSMAYRYGTNNLIQVNTDLPSDTPCVNFLATDNGCSIDQSANQYQQFGWVGMENVDGTIVLTFHFGAAFEAGQTYVLPKGAVFGFTDESKYTLDKNYTFTFDGSSWTMEAKEPPITLTYRWGNESAIQFNTNLPATTPCANFLTTDNGSSIDESANQYHNVSWIAMENVDGIIVLTFTFYNKSFEVGQNYCLPVGAIFGFTDGNKYELTEDINLYWDGSAWSSEAPVVEEKTISFTCRGGTSEYIQVNTDLPVDTPTVSFTTADNGCNIDESGNTVQWVGWIGMDNADGTIVLTFHFNAAFTAGQTYVLPKGAVFGFTDGNKYTLDKNYTFTFDGSSWTMTVKEDPITLSYRYGTDSLIQFNTNLPADITLANFTTDDNGCAFIQGGNQSVGWIGMEAVDGVVVLTFHFNSAFTVGQCYTLGAGSLFGFADGSKYELSEDITLYWDGSAWTTEEPVQYIELSYRWGNGNTIQFNTDLPADTPCVSFTTAENGCSIDESANQYQQVGWIGMEAVDGVIVLTFHFNSNFTSGQNYFLPTGAVFGFTDGSKYTLENDLTLYYDGSSWGTDPIMTLACDGGTDTSIKLNTNLPSTTPCVSFTADQNGCSIDQSANTVQWVGWIGMANTDGTIGLTFYFNSAFTYGQSYCLPKGAVFAFTDGSSYKLDRGYTFYWDGSTWSETEPVQTDVLDESNFNGGKEFISFADLPVDSNSMEKIEEYKGLGLNTSLLAEDHTGAQGPDERYSVSLETANAPEGGLNFAYRYGTSTLIQVNTNLPSTTPIVNFTTDQNGCSIDQSGNTVQWVGWISMADADGTIVLTFNFNNAFTAGQSYVLPKGAVFGFTDGNTYTLDADYTFTFDGSSWSMNRSTLDLSLNAGSAKYIQLKTSIPTGLTYGDFLLGDTSKGHNVILETTEGAQAVAWFSYSELDGAVYLTFNFNGYNKPGTQYTLKAGTALKAGDHVYTTDRDYILTVQNDYLTSLENLDNAGLNVWIRNYHNTADYFTDNLTATLLLYKDLIDGFYMTDEAFETNALLIEAGQETHCSDFESMVAVRDWFNTNFADKYYHSNHVPITSYDHYTDGNGNTLSEMNADYYKKFLETYKATYNDQLTSASGSSISFDNYPFIHAQGEYGGFLGIGATFESGIQDTYLLNCLIAAEVAGEYDFGLCVQTYEATDLNYEVTRDITSAAEVSLQLYTGMAMGADLFEYFAYNSNGDFNAIMNQDGTKRIYDLVAEGNKALAFHDVVNTFTWNGIMTSTGSANSDNDVAFESVADMVLTDASNGVLSSVSSTDDAVIGCFTKDALNGYMVVNFNDPLAVTGNNTVTVSFADCTRARVYTCVDGVLTSELVELTDGACTVTLAPGSGCFIIPA